ncbi:MAG TPA: hypothetical protein VFT62_04860 [Mycobacteriales bacterium]|nr:hypothetical protein [Mycobacteriales bacterium]
MELDGNDRIPRCCARHLDWSTLAEHLLRDFPELSSSDVLRELAGGRQAAAMVGLSADDALLIAELIARSQLLMLAGRSTDLARLDPLSRGQRRRLEQQTAHAV